MWYSLIFVFSFLLSCNAVEYLTDPSFENPGSNWQAFGSYSVSTTVKLDGAKSIFAIASDTSQSYGASQIVTIGQTSPAPVRLSGWSLSSSAVSVSSDANYAIYADVTYTDGSNQWGVNVPFAAGSAHTWQFQCDTIISSKKIASFTLYAMFRYHSGTVYFDKFSASSYTLPTVVTSSANPLKILFPLYIYPGAAWDTVQASASDVPITVIANPDSGPGTSQNSDYLAYINKLTASPKVPVLGYVHTSYGARDIATVKSEILSWKNWYFNISGIFLDEASYNLDGLAYYQELSNYIKSNLGNTAQVFLNPGTSTNENYTSFSDSIMFFEHDYATFVDPNPAVLPSGWPRAPCYSTYSASWKYKSNAAIYNTTSTQYQTVVDKAIEKGFGYVFVTDANLPNPYGALPSYWSSLVAYIKSKNV